MTSHLRAIYEASVSLAIWDHTVLRVTRHKCRPNLLFHASHAKYTKWQI